MDDLDDLLSGGNGADDALAHGPFLHSLQEVPGDLEVDVRLEQGAPHVAQPVADHGLGEDAPLAKASKGTVEPFAEAIEHG